jgi:hypothetical protein
MARPKLHFWNVYSLSPIDSSQAKLATCLDITKINRQTALHISVDDLANSVMLRVISFLSPAGLLISNFAVCHPL